MGALKHGMWMQRELSVISAQLNRFQGISQLYDVINFLKVTANIAVFCFLIPIFIFGFAPCNSHCFWS